MGRPRKDGTPARKPVKKTEPDMQKVRQLIAEANIEIHDEEDRDDVSGHKIAARYGYLRRIIEELFVEVCVGTAR